MPLWKNVDRIFYSLTNFFYLAQPIPLIFVTTKMTASLCLQITIDKFLMEFLWLI